MVLLDSVLTLLVEHVSTMERDEKIAAINQAKLRLHSISPFSTEPVDCVLWVKNELVAANDYNPNSVAPPEMELLKLSILEDGYTQPIVSWSEDGRYEVVDGYHRNRVGRECPEVKARIDGYLPLTVINSERTDRGDRIAATIRHNRARGKHKVDAMSDIVVELKRRNWSDKKISKQLGMDEDEVLRLTQITGLAEMFGDKEFSEAWEHTGELDEVKTNEDGLELEWMNNFTMTHREPGWHDRTESSSVLYGDAGKQKGSIQKSRFKDSEWFWYAYAQPIREGKSVSLELAKQEVEAIHNAS